MTEQEKEEEWDSSPHNKELAKIFSKEKVEAVKKKDLEDKDVYDKIEKKVLDIRRARERLQLVLKGA